MMQTDEKKDKKTTSILVVAFSIIISLGLMAIIDKADKETHPVLTSWTDNSIRSSIIYFMDSINNKQGTNYIKEEDRIAIFDLDGTLIAEKPLSIEMSFFKDSIPLDMRTKHPYSALINGDLKTVFAGNNYNRFFNIYSDIPIDEYKEKVKTWLRKYVHPHHNVSYLKMVYTPMKELISYLRENGFEIFLVTGSESTFVRTFAKKVFGIKESNIIGSEPHYSYTSGTVNRLKNQAIVTLKDNKPILIERSIGKKPVVAFGNSDDDLAMLEYVASTDKMKLVGLVTHTDSKREYEYQNNEKSLAAAERNGWLIVDMKLDFKEIFGE